MTTVVEQSFVDTNVLVYAAAPSAPQHQPSRALLESDQILCASAQVFAEFHAVATNPRRVTAPFIPSEARAFITNILPRFRLLPIPGSVVPRWAELAEKQSVTGHDVFDLQLIATMLESNVRRIYTFNRQDFEPFSDFIHILSP